MAETVKHTPSLTLADIDNAENAVKNVRVILQGIGREIYKMREGKELEPQYHFERYVQSNFPGSDYSGYEGPDWRIGTPVFSLRYWWARGEEMIVVTFPQSWLENDWRTLEADRLEKERTEQRIQEEAEAKKRKADREAAERATFERLKAKFEGGAA